MGEVGGSNTALVDGMFFILANLGVRTSPHTALSLCSSELEKYKDFEPMI